MNHEPTRWGRTGRPVSQRAEPSMQSAATLPQQQHLVSHGYPVRIRRAMVAGGLALALALGGSLAASLTSGSASPESAPGDASVTGPVSVDG